MGSDLKRSSTTEVEDQIQSSVDSLADSVPHSASLSEIDYICSSGSVDLCNPPVQKSSTSAKKNASVAVNEDFPSANTTSPQCAGFTQINRTDEATRCEIFQRNTVSSVRKPATQDVAPGQSIVLVTESTTEGLISRRPEIKDLPDCVVEHVERRVRSAGLSVYDVPIMEDGMIQQFIAVIENNIHEALTAPGSGNLQGKSANENDQPSISMGNCLDANNPSVLEEGLIQLSPSHKKSSSSDTVTAPESETKQGILSYLGDQLKDGMATREKHSSVNPYVCGVCEMKFVTKTELIIHCAVHSLQRPLNCYICSKSLKTENAWRRHLKAHAEGSSFNTQVGQETPEENCLPEENSPVHSEYLSGEINVEEKTEQGDSLKTGPENISDQDCNISQCEEVMGIKENLSVQSDSGSPPETELHECLMCNNSFSKKSLLEQHYLTHSRDQYCSCKLCDKIFINLKSLKVHIKSHFVEKPYQCNTCGKRFVTPGNLSSHSAIHFARNMHPCQLCEKSFVTRAGLIRHVSCHADPNGYVCEVCGKQFKSHAYLNEHKMSHGERKLTCEVCGKMFTRTYKLKKHVLIHTGERPHQCHVCGKAFVESTNLKTHLRIHSGIKPYECKLCDKRFNTTTEVKIHLRSHTNERPYECKYCLKKFKTSSRLCLHVRSHTGERPHDCSYCNKSFSSSSELSRHKVIHTGERPFACDLCGRGFKRKTHLNVHMKVHRKR